METVFAATDLGTYTPTHEKDLGASGTEESRRQLLARFGLRPDTLDLHGQARVDYFYNDRLKKMVANGVMTTDIQQFAEY